MSLPDRLLKTDEVAVLLRRSRSWVQEQLREGNLRGWQPIPGGPWLVDPKELEEDIAAWRRGEGPRWRKHRPELRP